MTMGRIGARMALNVLKWSCIAGIAIACAVGGYAAVNGKEKLRCGAELAIVVGSCAAVILDIVG